MADDLVREGNNAFVDDDCELAVRKYSEAIELSPTSADFYLKRSAAYMRLADYEAAAADASSAASLQPTNPKAHTRKGMALFHHEDFSAARQAFVDALELDKDNKELKRWIRKCDAEEDLAVNEAKQRKNSAEKVILGVASGTGATMKTGPHKDQSEEMDGKKVKTSAGASSDTSSSLNVATAVESVETSMSSAASVKEQPIAIVQKPRFDWYQTETHVTVTLMVKNAKPENVNVEYSEKALSVTVKLPSGSDYSLELELAHPVVVAQCRTKIMSSKIELRLKKVEGIQWKSLESDDTATYTQFPSQEQPKVAGGSSVHKYPSSRHVGTDWDRVAAEIAKEEKNEKLEGEAALNQLFQQIYGDGSEEVRRAMNKSFVESGGTVLSTNWEEVKKNKVDCKPPDGMEWKKWDR